MTEALVWLAVLAALPGCVILASFLPLRVERLRGLTVASAVSMVAVTCLVFFTPQLRELELRTPLDWGLLGNHLYLRVDELSSVLIPFTAVLWALTVSVTPRSALDRAGLARTAVATLLTTICFLTVSPPVLVLVWIGSTGVFLLGMYGPERRHARRVASAYLGASSVLLVAGVAFTTWTNADFPILEGVGAWLIVLAALIRKGIFPFHAWVPEVFDQGRLGPAVLFSAPQIGTYVALMLVVPTATDRMLETIVVLALLTAVYGALLALAQNDARRVCGYLFVSQSALVMAGLGTASGEALTGALVLWLSSGLAFAGLCRCTLVLEARRGRLDLRTYHGGYEHMPVLAASFLLMGLACSGFPGTLGFIGEELLVDGAIEMFPTLGYGVILAGALTGLGVLRMYFSLFCGSRDMSPRMRILPREAWTFSALTALLVIAGIAPGPIVTSRRKAGEEILIARTLGLGTDGKPQLYLSSAPPGAAPGPTRGLSVGLGHHDRLKLQTMIAGALLLSPGLTTDAPISDNRAPDDGRRSALASAQISGNAAYKVGSVRGGRHQRSQGGDDVVGRHPPRSATGLSGGESSVAGRRFRRGR
jgi:NADH-quinone oxidoreductase subunit M